ncbi:glycosyltransferase family 2 protein [Dickeya dadantii]|uniref:glycosyltransferase family 2 protein n=1 Tax=Dickeya dadantii TaxID=204038 RepID=UPI001C0C1BA5|nr:glycosyltransferase family 2 protein [Dickeya dadantii]QWT39998.1 glycosyltransferase family 2 protein [Dickeya dadantii]
MLTDKSSVFSVIVTYYPKIDNVIELITELKNQEVTPVVVDNGSLSEDEFSTLSTLCKVFRLDNNVGIAKAQNIGILYVKEKGGKGILFFDQDSKINNSFVNEIMSDYNLVCSEIGQEKLAAVGPVFTDSRYGFFYKFLKVSKLGFRKKISPEGISKPFEVSLIISSGSLLPVAVLDDVGLMDEDLFIDYVDTEWCLRAISKGYKVYVATSAKMSHAIGDKMVKFLVFNIPVHSPIRRYYRIRNAFLFSDMPHVPFFLRVRENVFNIIHQIILIASQRKLSYFSVMTKAIHDGLNFSKKNTI